jgi:DNA-directed RNA polymerase subunit L
MSYFSNLKEESENIIEFEINDGGGLEVVNGLRRIINAEIPYIGVDYDSITMPINTSMLHEKIYAMRLSDSPVYFNKNMGIYDKLELKLEIENKTDGIIDIFLKDFRVFDEDEKEVKIEDIFVYPNSLIGKLKYEQQIKLRGTFKLGTASKYGATFSHSAGSAFHFKRDMKKIKDLTKNMNEKEKNIFLTKEGDRHFLKDQFIFNIESRGCITAKECLEKALDVFKDKLENAKNNLNVIKKSDVKFLAYDFVFENESDTLGNVVQTYLLKNNKVKMSGYLVPHRLKNILIIRMALKEDNTLGNNKKVFIQSIDDTLLIIDKLIVDWKQM